MVSPSAPSPPPATREVTRREQSFPLISFVQLITYSVALVTCTDFKSLGKQVGRIPLVDWQVVATIPVAACLVGFLMGGAVGLGQIRKWRSFFLCGFVGAIVGLLILSAFAAPAGPLQACFACALPLLSTLVLRFRTS